METLVGVIVATPFAVNNMSPAALGNGTGGVEETVGLIGDYIRVRVWVGVAVVECTKGLLFEIVPGQGFTDLVLETRFGDPVLEFLCVVVMRTPRDVPGDGQRPAVDVCGRPIERVIPRRWSTVPGFAIETADVVRATAAAPYVVGQHAHKLIHAVGVLLGGGHTCWCGCLIGFLKVTAKCVSCRRIGH